jgi:large subunit ribosomal protein L10
MNRDQKSAVIEEIAASITDSSAIFAIDYRGISVEQARELRTRLREADATLRVVKNSLTERAADKAGVVELKELLSGPTALTFVRGDSALAAKSIADFARVTQLLAFKGGLMDGVAVSPAEITTISRLPSRQVLYGQLTGLVANPITGLARTLNALVAGLAVQLGGILSQREAAGETLPVSAPAAPEPETPTAEATAEADGPAEAEATAEASTDAEGPADAEAAAEAPADEVAAPADPAEESPSDEAPDADAAEASSDAAEASADAAPPEASAEVADEETPPSDPSTEDAPAGGSTTEND